MIPYVITVDTYVAIIFLDMDIYVKQFVIVTMNLRNLKRESFAIRTLLIKEFGTFVINKHINEQIKFVTIRTMKNISSLLFKYGRLGAIVLLFRIRCV